MRRILLFTALLSLLAYTACGGGNNDIPTLPNIGGGGGGNETPLNSTLKGKIMWEGAAPEPKKIQTAADPGCMNPGLVTEETVVSDGGLENVILYVSGGDLSGKTFPARQETVELDQKGCHYVPHALVLQTGQELKIVNSDTTAHNVHAWSMINMPFNEAQPHPGDTKIARFDKEEMHFPIKCDVHSWMNAFVGVFKLPMHTVSTKGGAFEMKMPSGKYEITAIHEKWGTQTQMVEIADGATAELNFTFKASGTGD